MRFAQHPSNNQVFRAPQGVSHDECHSLPVTLVKYVDGIQGIWSFWKPSAAELAALNAGATVKVAIMGNMQPMMSVGVDGVEEPEE